MIVVITALRAEASPFVSHFGLRLKQKKPFRMYESKNMRLVVSGIGKTAAAAATAYACTITPQINLCLNLGIAGHYDYRLNSLWHACEIHEQSTGNSWFMKNTIEGISSAKILTVDIPEKKYQSPWVYEMEAAGYYTAALRFVPAHLIYCFKIISDNKQTGVDYVNANSCSRLVKKNIDIIDNFLRR